MANPKSSHQVRENSSRLARRSLFGFIVTFAMARIFVFLIMADLMPNLYFFVKGTHVHHLNYGIFLLSAVAGVAVLRRPTGSKAELLALLYGVALALTFDEFGMWLHLGGSYWQRASIDAVILIAALFMLIAYAKDLERLESRHFYAFLLVALLLIAFGFVIYLGGTASATNMGRNSRPSKWPPRHEPGISDPIRAPLTTSLQSSKLENPWRWLAPLLSLFLLLALAAVYALKLATYARGYYSIDLALYANMFSNALKGHGFYTEYQHLTLGIDSFLNDHFEPSLYLLLPLYRLYPDPRLLLLIPCLAYAASCFLIYGIAREWLKDPLWALLGAAGYVLAPLQSWLLADIPHGFHPDCLIPFFAFACLFSYLKKNPWGFWIFLLLLLGIRENMPLEVALAVLLAFGFQAMPRRDAAMALSLCLLAYLAAFAYGLSTGHPVHSFERVATLFAGGGPGSFQENLYSWRWLSSFWPALGFLWAWIPVLLDMAMVLLIGESGSNWHAFPAIAVLSLGWILALKRYREGFLDFGPRQRQALSALLGISLAFGLYKNLQIFATGLEVDLARKPRFVAAELEALRPQLPPDAVLAASTDLLPRLAGQERLAWIYQWQHADYVLLNIPEGSLDTQLLDPSSVAEILDAYNRGQLQLVARSPSGLMLLKRKA